MGQEVKKRFFWIISIFIILSFFLYPYDNVIGGIVFFVAIIFLVLFLIYNKPSNEDIYKEQIPELIKKEKEKNSKKQRIKVIALIIFVLFLGLFIYFNINKTMGAAIMISGPIIIIFGSIQVKAALDFTEEDKRKIFEYMKKNDPSKLPDEETLKKYERMCGLYPIGNKKLYSPPAYLNSKKQIWMIYIYIILLLFFAVRGYLRGNIHGSMIIFGTALVMFFGIRWWYKRIKEGKIPFTLSF